MNEVKTTTIARINQVDILLIENGEKRVAIRPICEAIGVDYSGQLQKVKEDEILGPVVGLNPTTGKDGKQYEMVTIPFMFIFGWLFTISPKNVKEDARETLIKYKLECYRALYFHFTAYADFVEQKQIAIEKQLVVYEEARSNYSSANKIMKEAEQELKKFRQLRFEDYDSDRRQLKMFSEEEMGNKTE